MRVWRSVEQEEEKREDGGIISHLSGSSSEEEDEGKVRRPGSLFFVCFLLSFKEHVKTILSFLNVPERSLRV